MRNVDRAGNRPETTRTGDAWHGCVALLGWACLAVFGGGCGGDVDREYDVSLDSCLRDLTNVAVFAQTPKGVAHMVSTYDRTGGNSDWAQWSGPDKDGLLDVAVLKGPGCVKRIWTTSVRAKEWLFFFDGEKEARLRGTSRELFGERFPTEGPLCDLVSSARYGYLPLPFSRSLRIAVLMPNWKPDMRGYYHVNYETYSKDVTVASFPRELGPELEAGIRAVLAAWRDKEGVMRRVRRSCGSERTAEVPPGGSVECLRYEGGGVLKAFALKPAWPESATALARARGLRELVLRIYWDGSDVPSVEAPLGDFFCNAFHARSYSSIALAYVDGEYVSRFPMPFRKSARVVVANDGDVPVRVGSAFRVGPPLVGSDVNYFHARWHAGRSRGLPHRVLGVRGRGHYVGCFLSAIGMDGTWNILEGDESVRINGEAEPSMHGTGLEDYFNGGWYYAGLYDLPLQGLVEKAPIRTDQYRLHLPDPVRFTTGFSLDFEFGHGNEAQGYMSSVAYWYQDTPVSAGSIMPVLAQRFPPPDPWEPRALMAHLFELERVGLLEEARNRCLEYAEKYREHGELAALVRLRAVAYAEAVHGYDAVRAELERAARESESVVGKQARLLTWFHEESANALLGAHVNGKYRVYVDGRLVAQGDDPGRLAVQAVRLTPGPHVMTAEVTPTRPGAWATFHLRAHGVEVGSDRSWEYASRKPVSWPGTADDSGVTWQTVRRAAMLPTMTYWAFEPNAFIHMQSAWEPLGAWQGWDAKPGAVTAYLRKSFVIPSGSSE